MPTANQIDAVRRGFAVLSSMRGAAGKLEQLADFLDPGWVPPEDRAELEARLAEMRKGAVEPMPFKRVERLLRDAWGGKLANHLAEIEALPAARASAGQVHRGELADGRTVAIKLLRPGAEDALRADLGSLNLLLPLASTVMPGFDPGKVASELRDRALEEMDLEHEAQSQRFFARAYRGHPFVHVPAPVTELARTGVLVSEWVEGTPFDDVVALDAAERDRYGEILARFHVGSMFHTGAFHADPHPGNHLLQADRRVAFMDFGSVGRAEPSWLAGLLDAADAADADDEERLVGFLADLGYLPAPQEVDGRVLLDALLVAAPWLLQDRAVRIDAELGASILSDDDEPETRQRAEDLFARHGWLPARDLLAGRMVMGLSAVLLLLRATARWSALGRELRGVEEAATALGEAEAGFWATRGLPRRSEVSGMRRW